MMTSASMPLWAIGPFWYHTVLNVFLFLASLWLIILVLIQRGKGGGLAGAFGGAGGGSAFGSRAGDMFTKVTIYSAFVWILLIAFVIKTSQDTSELKTRGSGVVQQSTPPTDEGSDK